MIKPHQFMGSAACTSTHVPPQPSATSVSYMDMLSDRNEVQVSNCIQVARDILYPQPCHSCCDLPQELQYRLTQLESELFVYASGAQDVLTRGASSSPSGRALAAAVGLGLAVYCGFNASGACVNPCVALMFCLTGKLQWKRWPVYVVCEFLGAFLAACLTYGVYGELIDNFDGGQRQVYGENATSHIFTSYPRDDISKRTGFFDIFVGCGLLTSTSAMVIDPYNAKTASGVVPIALVLMVYGIIMSFGIQAGAPINLTIDFSGRFFAYIIGYGSEVYTRADYWFWVPPVACVCGTITFVTTYQLMVGNHLPMDDDDNSTADNDINNCKPDRDIRTCTHVNTNNTNHVTCTLDHMTSNDSIKTVSTELSDFSKL